MNTKYFNDDMQQLDPKNINAIHMPVLFLLDTSYSMDGEPIRKTSEKHKTDLKRMFVKTHR